MPLTSPSRHSRLAWEHRIKYPRCQLGQSLRITVLEAFLPTSWMALGGSWRVGVATKLHLYPLEAPPEPNDDRIDVRVQRLLFCPSQPPERNFLQVVVELVDRYKAGS